MNNDILSKQIRGTPLVVFDLETTGFSPCAGDEIVEIGTIRVLGDEIVSEFHSMINPVRPISPGASAVNGITNDMVKDAPFIEEMLPRFLEFIGDSPLVIQNASFDLPFIAWKCVEMGITHGNNLVFDTMLLARSLRPEFGKYNLETLVYRLGVEEAPDHRAVGDSIAAWQVFRKLMSPFAANGGITVARALSLQGGPYLWPRFNPSEVQPGPETEIETAIRLAIERGENLIIEYQSLNSPSPTTREIRPIHLARRPRRSYLIAYCLLRGEQRIFRVDRIHLL